MNNLINKIQNRIKKFENDLLLIQRFSIVGIVAGILIFLIIFFIFGLFSFMFVVGLILMIILIVSSSRMKENSKQDKPIYISKIKKCVSDINSMIRVYYGGTKLQSTNYYSVVYKDIKNSEIANFAKINQASDYILINKNKSYKTFGFKGVIDKDGKINPNDKYMFINSILNFTINGKIFIKGIFDNFSPEYITYSHNKELFIHDYKVYYTDEKDLEIIDFILSIASNLEKKLGYPLEISVINNNIYIMYNKGRHTQEYLFTVKNYSKYINYFLPIGIVHECLYKNVSNIVNANNETNNDVEDLVENIEETSYVNQNKYASGDAITEDILDQYF